MAREGRKVGLLKRRAEPAGQMRDEKLHAVVAQSTFASEKAKSTSRSEHFLKLRCRKVYGVVARSTFRSQNGVSLNCCVSDVVKFTTGEVSQNSLVFKLADRQTDRQTETDRQAGSQTDRQRERER